MNETIHYISDISYIVDVNHLKKHIKYITRAQAKPITTINNEKLSSWLQRAKYEKAKRYDSRLAIKFVLAMPNNANTDFYQKVGNFLSAFFNVNAENIDMTVHRDNVENIHMHVLIYPRTPDNKKVRLNRNDLKKLHKEWDIFLESQEYRVVRDEVEDRIGHLGWRLHAEPELKQSYTQYKQHKKQKKVLQEELHKLKRESIISLIKESQDMVFEYSELFCRLEIERQEREAIKKMRALDMLLSQLEKTKTYLRIEYNIKNMEGQIQHNRQAISNQQVEQSIEQPIDQPMPPQTNTQTNQQPTNTNNQNTQTINKTQTITTQEKTQEKSAQQTQTQQQSDLERIQLVLELERKIQEIKQQTINQPQQLKKDSNIKKNIDTQKDTNQQQEEREQEERKQEIKQEKEIKQEIKIDINIQKIRQDTDKQEERHEERKQEIKQEIKKDNTIKQDTDQQQEEREQEERQEIRKQEIEAKIEAIMQEIRQEVRQAFKTAIHTIDNGIERINKKTEEQQAKQNNQLIEQKANQQATYISRPKPLPAPPPATQITEDEEARLKRETLGIEPIEPIEETEPIEENLKDTREPPNTFDIDIGM